MKNRKSVVWSAPEVLLYNEGIMPKIGPGEVLVRVESCAICGSDLRILKHGNSRVKSGQIIGHEISGVISKVADDVEGWHVGDHISVGADIPCGQCIHCLSGRANCCDINYAIGHQFEGGFTDYMILNKLTLTRGPVVKLLKKTDFDFAALAEPLACCINGYERGLMTVGRSVVIFGAGPIGMMLGMLAFTYQAPKVILIDTNMKRLQMAASIGVGTHFLDSSVVDPVVEVLRLTEGLGADMIFTACPAVETHEHAIAMVAKRGVVNLFGGLPQSSRSVALDSNFIHYREAYITGSHGSTPEQHAKAVQLIESGQISVDRLVTHRFSLEEINEAYKVASSGEAIKVVIKPNEQSRSL